LAAYKITVFLYVEPRFENEFLEYESAVLPLLKKHNGSIECRFRPAKEDAAGQLPFEIHVISFASKADFESYKNDPERKKYHYLSERSIIKTEIFESVKN